MPRPGKHDFQAAEDYLSLVMSPEDASAYRDMTTRLALGSVGLLAAAGFSEGMVAVPATGPPGDP